MKMPSNDTYVCYKCRRGFKQTYLCPSCGQRMKCVGHKISIPKKSNIRMWRRMENGQLRWNKKKVWRGEEFNPWNKDSWIKLPGHKKGQSSRYMGTGPRSERPDMPGK